MTRTCQQCCQSFKNSMCLCNHCPGISQSCRQLNNKFAKRNKQSNDIITTSISQNNLSIEDIGDTFGRESVANSDINVETVEDLDTLSEQVETVEDLDTLLEQNYKCFDDDLNSIEEDVHHETDVNGLIQSDTDEHNIQ